MAMLLLLPIMLAIMLLLLLLPIVGDLGIKVDDGKLSHWTPGHLINLVTCDGHHSTLKPLYLKIYASNFACF